MPTQAQQAEEPYIASALVVVRFQLTIKSVHGGDICEFFRQLHEFDTHNLIMAADEDGLKLATIINAVEDIYLTFTAHISFPTSQLNEFPGGCGHPLVKNAIRKGLKLGLEFEGVSQIVDEI